MRKRIEYFFKKIKVQFLKFKTEKKIKQNMANNASVIIVKYDGIGDFILFLDVAKEFKKTFSGKRIFLSCRTHCVSIAEKTGYFDEIIPFREIDFSLKNIGATYKKISKLSFDILIHYVQPRHFEGNYLTQFINAKRKIGLAGEPSLVSDKERNKRDKDYDELIYPDYKVMLLRQYAFVLSKISNNHFYPSLPSLNYNLSTNLALPANYFVVFLGGSIFHKIWPANRYYQVAKFIIEETGWDCVLCGNKNDMIYEENFKGAEKISYYSYIGKTSIDELIYLISKSKLLIGNDTSAIHIANAVGIQSFVIKGQFSGNKFLPYDIGGKMKISPIVISAREFKCSCCITRKMAYQCIQGDYYSKKTVDCIFEIETSQVINMLKKYFINGGNK